MRKEKMLAIGSDKDKAAKYIIAGIVIAVIFGTIMGISKLLANNATVWANYLAADLADQIARGVVTAQEAALRTIEIDLQESWMLGQQIILGSIATIGVNIGLILLFVGFIGIAINDSIDDRTRKAALVIAGTVIFILMISTFFGTVGIVMTP